MKPSNGFNKKQKEEIREIVKSEIGEALRKKSKSDPKVKDEVEKAIYSVLNEKDDNLIKNLIEIENKISMEETEKSLFAGSMKYFLYALCLLAFGFVVLLLIATVYLCITDSSVLADIFSVILVSIIYIMAIIILIIFHKSIKRMNKNDSYNSLMFIITIIAFIITILSTSK